MVLCCGQSPWKEITCGGRSMYRNERTAEMTTRPPAEGAGSSVEEKDAAAFEAAFARAQRLDELRQ